MPKLGERNEEVVINIIFILKTIFSMCLAHAFGFAQIVDWFESIQFIYTQHMHKKNTQEIFIFHYLYKKVYIEEKTFRKDCFVKIFYYINQNNKRLKVRQFDPDPDLDPPSV